MTALSPPAEPPRRLSAWLLAGLIVAPIVFLGLVFRDGYSLDLRIAAVAYAVVMTGWGLVRMALGT